jgi:hypothetical protein
LNVVYHFNYYCFYSNLVMFRVFKNIKSSVYVTLHSIMPFVYLHNFSISNVSVQKHHFQCLKKKVLLYSFKVKLGIYLPHTLSLWVRMNIIICWHFLFQLIRLHDTSLKISVQKHRRTCSWVATTFGTPKYYFWCFVTLMVAIW